MAEINFFIFLSLHSFGCLRHPDCCVHKVFCDYCKHNTITRTSACQPKYRAEGTQEAQEGATILLLASLELLVFFSYFPTKCSASTLNSLHTYSWISQFVRKVYVRVKV